MMEALLKRGLSVASLAENKGEDMRESMSCWVSQPITQPGFGFKRILCFEQPYTRGTPPELVGDIFLSIAAVIGEEEHPLRLAMPLVSTGSMDYEIAEMMEPLLDAAVNQMYHGLPVESLKIFEYSPEKALEMKGAFGVIKRRYQLDGRRYGYDLFISYNRKNSREADFLINDLLRQRSDLRIFLDRKELNTGSASQQGIYDALETCAHVVALYSPEYLQSRMCKEEFNIAMLRNRDNDCKLLLPIYLHSTNLPYYMRNLQYKDCREGDPDKLRQASEAILKQLD